MKKYLRHIAIFILMGFMVFAHAATIRGVVTDAETNEPMAGVNIILRGTYYGAASGMDGSYTITQIRRGK